MTMQFAFDFDAPDIALRTRVPFALPQPRVRHPRRRRTSVGRYRSSRRPAERVRAFVGFGAYRLVIVGTVAHVIGPGGRACEPLQAFARALLEQPRSPAARTPGVVPASRGYDPAAEARRVMAAIDAIRMLLEAVNTIHVGHPDVLADLLDEKPGRARDVILYWLSVSGCDVGNGRGRNGGKIVYPPSGEEQWRIGVTLSRFRQVFDFWNDAGIREGHNPMQMDKGRSRLAGAAKVYKRSPQRWWLDVDGLFRTKVVDRQAPRPGDQSIPRRILERGRELGWPPEVSLKFETMYRVGGRIGQVDAMTALSLFGAVPGGGGDGLAGGAKDENHVALIQKGSRGRLTWQARVPPDLRRRLIALVAGHVEGGEATLRRWATSGRALDRAKLAAVFVFSEDGRRPTPAWKSSHLLRLAVESLGLSFAIRRDDGTVVTKHFTSHWFRHMFVNGMLDRIAASALDQAAKDEARAKFARYMGWANAAGMLAYYGRHHFDQEVALLVASHQDDLNAELWRELEEEGFADAANDNGIGPVGRCVGDLLDDC